MKTGLMEMNWETLEYHTSAGNTSGILPGEEDHYLRAGASVPQERVSRGFLGNSSAGHQFVKTSLKDRMFRGGL